MEATERLDEVVGLSAGARLVGVTPHAVEKQVRRGRIRVLVVGDRRFFAVEDLKAYRRRRQESKEGAHTSMAS